MYPDYFPAVHSEPIIMLQSRHSRRKMAATDSLTLALGQRISQLIVGKSDQHRVCFAFGTFLK